MPGGINVNKDYDEFAANQLLEANEYVQKLEDFKNSATTGRRRRAAGTPARFLAVYAVIVLALVNEQEWASGPQQPER